MYKNLTKVTEIDGKQYVTCIYHGTDKCRIHNGIANCGQCPVMAAILNQLHTFEEALSEAHDDAEE